jgi:hypothetical protein
MTRHGNGRRWLSVLALIAFAGAGEPAGAKSQGTRLLFTFVTNQAGFDTTLTIANTTQDPFGTTLVDGACTLHFFGSNPPAPIDALIGAGSVFQTTTSGIAPNFQGYVIADCEISLLHGWAIVHDVSFQTFGASYPALVIPPGKRKKLERLDE